MPAFRCNNARIRCRKHLGLPSPRLRFCWAPLIPPTCGVPPRWLLRRWPSCGSCCGSLRACPAPCPSGFGSKPGPEELGCSAASRPVPSVPVCFRPTPGRAPAFPVPAGLRLGQTLTPVIWGGGSPLLGSRGDARASAFVSGKASRGWFVCYSEALERSSKADSNPLQRLAEENGEANEEHPRGVCLSSDTLGIFQLLSWLTRALTHRD